MGFDMKTDVTSACRNRVNGTFVFFFTFRNPNSVDPDHENREAILNSLFIGESACW
ncbi:hypothetical protein BGLA2_2070002 [Burkholderia gladioli]|nr:hypothetical protein BGLA2_2070002 [Burkholderia gladioli]